MARRGLTKPAEMEAAINGTDSARPTNDEIAQRAYAIYIREGRVDGRDMDNWLRAETELIAERKDRMDAEDSRQEESPEPRGNGKNSSTRPGATVRRSNSPEKAGV